MTRGVVHVSVYWVPSWAGSPQAGSRVSLGGQLCPDGDEHGPEGAHRRGQAGPPRVPFSSLSTSGLLLTSSPWKPRVPGDGNFAPVCPAPGEHPFSLGGVKSPHRAFLLLLPQQAL